MNTGRLINIPFLILVCLMASVAQAQTTWYVDDDAPGDPGPGDSAVSDPLEDGSAAHPFDAIQEAINAAVDGDEVLAADGIYTGAENRDLDFSQGLPDGQTRAITVRSENGREDCIIDCEGSGRGFYFDSGEGPDSVVEGLTITNGYADNLSPGSYTGGGVYCFYSSPTLIDCEISWNSATSAAGLSCYESSPTLNGCRISGNTTTGGSGGLSFNYSSDATLTNCEIINNMASGSGGGGFTCHNSDPIFISCVISENSANGGGGGFSCSSSSGLSMTDCTISGNSANKGGGVYFGSTSSATLTNCSISGNSAILGGGVFCTLSGGPTLTGCKIYLNTASEDGGGLFGESSNDPTLINCTISRNSAGDDGGGLYCVGNDPTLTHCTISENVAGDAGGGMRLIAGSIPTMTNCILWGDLPQEVVTSSNPIVTYCNVEGGTGEPWFGADCIDVDPQFAFAGDFHLMPGSPCIDAGTNSPPGGLPAGDLEGNARQLDGNGDIVAVADMGAYEFDSAAPAIALDSTGFEFSAPEGGANPSDQTLLLRNSGTGTLNWQVTGQPAWLVVSPASGQSSGEVGQFVLGVDIGGLDGGLYTAVLDVADPQAVNSPFEVHVSLYVTTTLHVPGEYPTIQAAMEAAIRGDVVEIADGTYTGPGNKNLDFRGKVMTVRSASGDPELCIIDCENEGRGFRFSSGEGPDSIVAGLAIINGNVDADGPEPASDGGGVSCAINSSPTLTNCRISNNSSSFSGGGVYCHNYSSPTLTHCTISGNWTNGSGGGVYCYNYSSPTLTNCAISGNSGPTGGGIYCHTNCSPVVTNCEITANDGCGLYCRSASSPTLSNCTFSGNSDFGAGGVYAHGSIATLTNCVLWGDSPPELDFGSAGAGLVVNFCNVQGGTGEAWFGADCIDVDPLFVDPDGPDDDPATWEDNDYRLAAGSPCIDAAHNMLVPLDLADLDQDGDIDERIPLDLELEPRFVDDPDTPDTGVTDPPDYPEVVDMGAYEYQLPLDCNSNGTADGQDIADATSLDCNTNGIPDECEYPGCDGILLADMNCDGLASGADIQGFVNYVLADRYTCQADMDQDGILDQVDLFPFVWMLVDGGPPPDCNSNGMFDYQDIADGMSLDCDSNGIPDECDFPDCQGILPADMNCDGVANGADIQTFADYVLAGQYTCQADMNRDDIVDLQDVSGFVWELLGYVWGDVNGDGTLDDLDVHAFVLALVDPDTFAAQYPGGHVENVDVNHDGLVNSNDIQPFVNGLLFP